jgi:hypothetical protein
MGYPLLTYGQMVTVRNRFADGRDEYGNDKYSYTETVVGPCSVQQASSRENISNTDQVVTGMTVFMPFGTEIGYLDSVIINGAEYEVTGTPDTWTSPFSGHTAPIMVRCVLVQGAST